MEDSGVWGAFIEAFVMSYGDLGAKPQNLQTLQTIPDADDTIDIMVCQLFSNLKNL